MLISENQFNRAFHKKEAWKYDLLHRVSKSLIYIIPLISIIIFKLWIIPVVIILELFFYLLSVKMCSLRDINIFAAREFRMKHQMELNDMFK